MSNGNSVTHWIDGLKVGDNRDIERLWERYFERLVRLAGARLPIAGRRAFDEEDVALSAFHSFCDRVGRGQFSQLDDREDLWKLLATITTRKAIGTLRHQSRQKRGGGRLLGESAVADDDSGLGGIAQFLSREPTPEAAVGFADDCDRLFERLADPTLKAIALRKLEGHSTDEIARELGKSTKTVDRKLHLIRAIWEEELLG